jgi:hypothetical protein
MEARFEFSTAMKDQVEVFWIVTPCSDVVGYQRLGGSYCLQIHSKDGGNKILRSNPEDQDRILNEKSDHLKASSALKKTRHGGKS